MNEQVLENIREWRWLVASCGPAASFFFIHLPVLEQTLPTMTAQTTVWYFYLFLYLIYVLTLMSHVTLHMSHNLAPASLLKLHIIYTINEICISFSQNINPLLHVDLTVCQGIIWSIQYTVISTKCKIFLISTEATVISHKDKKSN